MTMECRRHHHQSQQGVCPSCLRERLSSISSNRYNNSKRHSNATYGFDSSSAASPPSSSWDVTSRPRHHRHGSDVMVGSMSFVISDDKSGVIAKGLKKSRSIAFVPEDYGLVNVGEVKKTKKGKKKRGFWSKLLHLKGSFVPARPLGDRLY